MILSIKKMLNLNKKLSLFLKLGFCIGLLLFCSSCNVLASGQSSQVSTGDVINPAFNDKCKPLSEKGLYIGMTNDNLPDLKDVQLLINEMIGFTSAADLSHKFSNATGAKYAARIQFLLTNNQLKVDSFFCKT